MEESDAPISSFQIDPRFSFHSIPGGQKFICSLRSGDSSFFYWNGISQEVDCLYSGPAVLTELSVGKRHVATIEGDPMRMQTIRYWRHGWRHGSDFPLSVNGVFHSLTSGDVFTCAISGTHEVHCWGPLAKWIMTRFAGLYMRSVTAGGSRMCGLNMTGHLICSGEHLKVPPG